MIVDDMLQDKQFHENQTQRHKLVITGSDPVPTEISKGGIIIYRSDQETLYEEADIIIVQQLLASVAEDSEKVITVVADDTGVFVLLLHYYSKANIKNVILMESLKKEKSIIDIKKP